MTEYWNDGSGRMGDYELGHFPIYPIFHLSSIPLFHMLDKLKAIILSETWLEIYS
jgi:hypothetical protein